MGINDRDEQNGPGDWTLLGLFATKREAGTR